MLGPFDFSLYTPPPRDGEPKNDDDSDDDREIDPDN